MAYLGWFDGELNPEAWWDAELEPVAWWDAELVNSASGGPVTHATTGALNGPGSTVAGAASNFTVHSASGILAGQGSSAVGGATNFRAFGSAGALVGQQSTVNGSSTNFRAFGTSGALIGNGAVVIGDARRADPPITHDTSGALSGLQSIIVGAAGVGIIVEDTQGGGPGHSVSHPQKPKRKAGEGWHRERWIQEQSLELRAAKTTLAQSENRVAKRISRKIENYSQDFDQLKQLSIELAKLKVEYENQLQLKQDLEQAAQVVEDFLNDERDAIDLAFVIADFDARCVLAASALPF